VTQQSTEHVTLIGMTNRYRIMVQKHHTEFLIEITELGWEKSIKMHLR